VRNDLSREFPNPHFYHFATDIAGKRLISDAAPFNQGGKIYMAELGEPGRDPLRRFRYLLCPSRHARRALTFTPSCPRTARWGSSTRRVGHPPSVHDPRLRRGIRRAIWPSA